MLFIYSVYDYVLAEKQITTTLKNETAPRNFTLQIITPARKFLFMPYGGGLVKISRLYDENGKLIHARNYSDELKAEIKVFKKNFKIPYFQLWKGMVYTFVIILIASLIFGIKNKIGNLHRADETAKMVENVKNLQPGQLYGVTFFTDKDGNSIDGVPAGWIKIAWIEGDTLFVQRGKKMDSALPVFDVKKIESIKPHTEDDWEAKVEKMNYALLKEQLKQTGNKAFDLLYIGTDRDKYNGVIFTIKGAE